MQLPPIHAHPDVAAVRALLATTGLPAADLTAASLADFWGCHPGTNLIGVVRTGRVRDGRPAPFAGGRAGLARAGPGDGAAGLRRTGREVLHPARLCSPPARGHTADPAPNRRIRCPVPGERGAPDQSPVEPADLPLLCTFPQCAEEFCSCCFQPRLIHSLSSRWPPPCRALSYIELTNAQPFDAFLGFPGYAERFIPLHVYLIRALNGRYAHLTTGVPAAAEPSRARRAARGRRSAEHRRERAGLFG